MKRYSEDFIKEAEKLRIKEKLSYRELGRRINVPSATIGNWFMRPIGNRWDSLIRTNEKKREKYRLSENYVVPKLNLINVKQAKLIVAILYGCEGSKYPATKGISFSNSDPDLILAFLKLLRKSFKLKNDKYSIHLQIHSNDDFQKLREFWSKFLKIPEENFIKPTITVPSGKKHRKNYQGTCTLRYRDYRIQLKLLGIFEKFVKSFSELA